MTLLPYSLLRLSIGGNQVKGEYATKGEKMKVYLKEIKALLEGFEIEVIPRESNQEEDTLSKYAWKALESAAPSGAVCEKHQ